MGRLELPTSKARITFAPEPELLADITYIAAQLDTPVSTIVGSAMRDMAPAFRQMVAALQFQDRAERKAAELGAKYTGEFKRVMDPYLERIGQATAEAEAAMQRIEANRPKQVTRMKTRMESTRRH